jgi:LuxR family maltose regulon positive regulatory protein
LINEITQLESDLILVLDDYHVIESEKIHAGIGYLLEHQPPNLHILLVTRADPSISLARLRAHNQLIEIRAEELQFSLEEAATLLNEKMGLNLNSEQVAALNTHTESWVVGLQLAALSMKGKPSYETFINEFTGGHKFILDYLIEEVLVNLPEPQREFMLRTSILDRFCSELCQAVTGDPSSQQMLDDIWKSNLFLIPLDADGRWFRYHHLFAEVLQALLEQDLSGELTALHLKAAAWFESEGQPGDAVDHGLRSGNMQAATDLFLKHWMPFLRRGEVATVLRWLDALPDEAGRDNPSISLAKCWALFLSWQNSAIEPYLDQATAAYERLVGEGKLNKTQQDQIVGQLAMIRSVVARDRGDHAMSVAYVEEAVHLIPEDMPEEVGTAWNMLAAARAGSGDFDGAIKAYTRGITLSHVVGNLVGAYGCIYGKIMYMLIQGRLSEAEDFCRSSIEGAIRAGHGEFPATGWLHIAMARIDLEKGRLEEAEVSLRDGLRIARPGGFSEAVRAGRYLRVHLSALRGEMETAEVILKDTAGIVNAIEQPYLSGELNWNWAVFSLNTGDLDTAHEKLQILYEKGNITKHANLLLWHRWLSPRLLYEEGHYEEALASLDEMISRAQAVHSTGELIRMLAMQALALDGIGDHEQAQDALREAVGLAAPEGYIWLWLNAGPGIEPLLLDLKDNSDISQSCYPYLDAILQARQTAFEGTAQRQTYMDTDLLTPRELEIVHLISKGYSNPEIASELVVTLNTIKKHTSNIYSKLGVRSRTQAVARAQELNLL